MGMGGQQNNQPDLNAFINQFANQMNTGPGMGAPPMGN